MACILILSDEHSIRQALYSVLMEVGFTVATDRLTRRSPEMDPALSPQAILVDLPGWMQTRVSPIAELRSRYPAARIIALFGGGGDDVARLAQLWGVDSCLFKPFGLDALLAAVDPWSVFVRQNSSD